MTAPPCRGALVQHCDDRDEAIAARDTYAAILRAQQLTDTYGIGIEPHMGGVAVFLYHYTEGQATR